MDQHCLPLAITKPSLLPGPLGSLAGQELAEVSPCAGREMGWGGFRAAVRNLGPSEPSRPPGLRINTHSPGKVPGYQFQGWQVAVSKPGAEWDCWATPHGQESPIRRGDAFLLPVESGPPTGAAGASWLSCCGVLGGRSGTGALGRGGGCVGAACMSGAVRQLVAHAP